MTRVTVIDDDRDLLNLYVELLAELEFEVDTHTDALPGIEKLAASRPDLIIIDVELHSEREELTGLQIAHSVRSGTALRDVPIIICTTALPAVDAVWPALMERGDIHRLEKPFDVATFERVLQTALGLDHGRVDAPGAGSVLAAGGRTSRKDRGNGA